LVAIGHEKPETRLGRPGISRTYHGLIHAHKEIITIIIAAPKSTQTDTQVNSERNIINHARSHATSLAENRSSAYFTDMMGTRVKTDFVVCTTTFDYRSTKFHS